MARKALRVAGTSMNPVSTHSAYVESIIKSGGGQDMSRLTESIKQHLLMSLYPRHALPPFPDAFPQAPTAYAQSVLVLWDIMVSVSTWRQGVRPYC